MDGDGGFGIRNWAYYDQPSRSNLGLQLMSSVVAERNTKPFLPHGGLLHRDSAVPEHLVPMEFVRDRWISHQDNNKFVHVLPMNNNYPVLPDVHTVHSLQMLQPSDPPKDDEAPMINEPSGDGDRKDVPLKKRRQGPRPCKSPKRKTPKKVSAPREETTDRSVSRGRASMKSTGLVINGIDLDLSGIPTPVCSCTGVPQQCYRWGIGGWQSACCTTNLSIYPLPMSAKRRGARIAGRKMSLGAFKKVLEKLAGEGYNLSNPIDLRTYWAKHGTNKFVTIR